MKHITLLTLVGLWLLCGSGCKTPVEIIAHRGASHLAPENTLAAVMLGWEKKAHVEVDVYLTRDSQIVAIHDSTTKRTAGVDVKVAETTAHELRQLDVGRFKAMEFAGERIPLLAEILPTIPPQRKLFIEIKCGQEILPVLEPLLVESGMLSRVVIIGFNLETVTRSKERIHVPTYWLKGTEKNKDTDQWIPHDPQLVDEAKQHGLEGLNVHYAGVTQELVNAAHAADQKLFVWTVDDPNEAMRLVNLGVNGITTNRPGWLREQLDKNGTTGKQ